MKRHRWLWTLLGVAGGFLFLWSVVFKIIVRIAARFGYATPCPISFAFRLLDNPIRRRYTRPVLDRVGIQPGDVVLKLVPVPGSSPWPPHSVSGHGEGWSR